MTEAQSLLLILAQNSRLASALLRDAVCDGCESCTAQISDINRHTVYELSECERRYLKGQEDQSILRAAHALSECVTRAFSAAMLLERELPHLSPLSEVAASSMQLAEYTEQLLTEAHGTQIHTYAPHLSANKGRGAIGLLLSNICSTDSGRRLLPLVLALESHRASLERAYGVLMECM